MATIVLFHSVLGLRPGVTAFAQLLEAAGHTVHTPDLYDGETFDEYATGGKKWDGIGIPGILERANKACNGLAGPLVFAGFSNGAAVAEILAATHPEAQAAVLMHGALPLEMAQIPSWPKNVAVQLHYNEHDPFRDPKNDEALKQAVEASGAPFTEYLYPGSTHLFADPGLSDYDADSARQMTKRVLSLLI
jgi:dienelactone hydrolase